MLRDNGQRVLWHEVKTMTYLTRKTSRVRLLEAENARKNRLEIVKALSHGQITKRDLFKWGI